MNPDLNEKWPSEYLKFLTDFTNAAESELFDTKDQMLEYLEDLYLKNNNDLAEPSRINVNYVARLIYQEKKWIKEVLLKHFKNMTNGEILEKDLETASNLIDLGLLERIDLKEKTLNSENNFEVQFDINQWKKDRFKKSIYEYEINKKSISFLTCENRKKQIKSLNDYSNDLKIDDFYIKAMNSINPRSNLLYILDY